MAFPNSKFTVLSGGLATEIERRNVSITGDPLWSARVVSTKPHVICDIHKSGADIITTASYQASVDGYQKYLEVSSADALELIGQSVAIAIEAKKWFMDQSQFKGRMTPLIGGCVGPYGACLHDGSEYSGSYMDTISEQLIKEWHKPRISKLLEFGVDFLAIETIPSLKEAVCVLDVLKQYPNAKAWVSFSCKDNIHTCYGDVFAKAVDVIDNHYADQVLAVGINCTPPQFVLPLLQSCSSSTKPFVVYPNSGQEWLLEEEGYKFKGPKTFDHCLVEQWYKNGATIIGGCCNVTPEDIANIRSVLDSIQ